MYNETTTGFMPCFVFSWKRSYDDAGGEQIFYNGRSAF
jgi:ribonucleotide reductase alpha subunit